MRLVFKIALCGLLFISLTNQAFSNGKLSLKGLIQEAPDPIRACEIIVRQDGAPNIHAKSNENGKFSVMLDIGKDYIVEFSKKGYVTKKIKVSSLYMSDLEKNYILDELMIDLFRTEGNYNYNILKNPIAIIKFKPRTNEFGYDLQYNAKIQEKVQILWNEVRDERVKRDSSYTDAINQANQYFTVEDFANAKIFYELALEYRKMAKWPFDQLALINSLTPTAEEEIEVEIIDNAISTKEEVVLRGNKIITKRFVRKGNRTIKYHSVENKYGQIYYFKKNFPITFSTWYSESTED